MNKVLLGLFLVIIVIGVFVGGFYFGIHTVASMKNTSILQDNFMQSTQIVRTLEYLDDGKVELARQIMLLNLDTTILSMDSIAKYSDNKSYETACNILKSIAKYRKNNQVKYSNYIYPLENQQSFEVRQEVSRVLHKWESCTKLNQNMQ